MKKKISTKMMIMLGFAGIILFAKPVLARAALFSPKNLLANGVGNSVVISWSPVDSATGYEVYEKREGELIFRKVCRTSGCKKVLPSKKRKHVYYYKVRAYRKVGRSVVYGNWSRVTETRIPRAGSRSTLKNFLTTAFAPVGQTMYIYGGGWTSKWAGKAADGAWIGLNPTWRLYAGRQTKSFNYRKVRFKLGYGLDCSGYVGWTTYNALKKYDAEKGNGYVCKSTRQARSFARRGWGFYRRAKYIKDYRAGDVMSTKGHVYIVIGKCPDGSLLFLHSSPPGVSLCGTWTRSGNKNSQAVRMAKKYMKKYFPSWYRRYSDYDRSDSFLKKYNQFRWYLSEGNVMSDPDGYRDMSPEKILDDLLKKKK